jgi:bifunctional non-homologous end joining protein LigD
VLEDYRSKRNFQQTPEPVHPATNETGPNGAEKPNDAPLIFCIQEHHASHLHWDLRLELDGVLKSWAVPKGPSLNPADKRLAVLVEDHPIAYASFEGTIPTGQYGAGSVLLWDKGTFAPDEPDLIWDNREVNQQRLREGLVKGKLSITFRGVKMKGSWALVKLQKTKTEWLLLKHRDGYESETVDLLQQSASVNRPAVKNAEKALFPDLIEPMLAEEADKPFNHDAWTFEVKLDGVRTLAYKQGDAVKLLSRSGQNITARFPDIAREIRELPQENLVLDGELVQFDASGRPSFAQLMESYNGHRNAPQKPLLYLFDVLYEGDELFVNAPFQDRRALLEHLRPPGPRLKLIDSFPTHGVAVFEQAVKLGFEGVIAKRSLAPYRTGKRNSDWQKIKSHRTEDFVVVGYLPGKGGRQNAFGSLVLARQDHGGWKFCGNVGTGFDDATLDAIFKQLKPFETQEPTLKVSKKEIAKDGVVHWVLPELIAEVRFHAWTPDGKVRFPVFERIRSNLDTQGFPQVAHAATIPVQEDANAKVAKAIEAAPNDYNLDVEGQTLRLSNLNKVLFPATEGVPSFTKRDVLLYYCRVAKVMLPHLSQRPLAYVRYPNGIDGDFFFQKHAGDNAPSFVQIESVYSEHNGKAVEYLTVENLATLLWLSQLGALELHPWQSRAKRGPFDTAEDRDASLLEYPDFMVLDLDPYTYSGKEAPGAEPELNEKGWRQAVEVALKLRDVLQAINLTAFLKTSGKTGLHIFVPLETEYTYAQVRAVAKTLGDHLLRIMPSHVTTEFQVKKRPAKVFFDSGQNVMGKTLAAAYSTRPTPGGRVSFPLLWGDLESAYPSDFTMATVPAMLNANGDIWADILQYRQRIG